MMTSGRCKKWLGQLRTQMHLNYIATMALLEPHLARLTDDQLYISQPSCGPCIWFQLPVNLSSQALWNKVIEKKLSIAPGIMFSVNGRYDNYFRITFALP
jgi:DNA-binding transcriptional MocR family regulator